MRTLRFLTFPGRLFVASTVLDTMRREARQFRLKETGGVLFGYRSAGDIVLTAATGPGPDAKHGLRYFEPDTRYCQRQLDAVYKRSNAIITYQGDWHTHPRGETIPSAQDLDAMLGLAGYVNARQPEPILWIHRPAYSSVYGRRTERNGVWLLDAACDAWRSATVSWIS